MLRIAASRTAAIALHARATAGTSSRLLSAAKKQDEGRIVEGGHEVPRTEEPSLNDAQELVMDEHGRPSSSDVRKPSPERAASHGGGGGGGKDSGVAGDPRGTIEYKSTGAAEAVGDGHKKTSFFNEHIETDTKDKGKAHTMSQNPDEDSSADGVLKAAKEKVASGMETAKQKAKEMFGGK